MLYHYEQAYSIVDREQLINRKGSNMDARKMFFVLAYTTLLSSLLLKLYFNKLCSVKCMA